MFNLLKKKKSELPPFELLNSSEYQNKYFIRIAEWHWINKENITVFDPNQPRILTLDQWPQLVFIAANGQMTVKEYVHYMAGKYSGNVPAILDKTILDQINTLLEYGIIKIQDHKERPEPQFELPKNK